MVINAIVAIGLWPWLGWLSPAMATVISSWAMVAMLKLSSRKFGDLARVKAETMPKIARVAIASIAMGVVLGAAQLSAGGYFTNGAMQFIWALVLVTLGAAAYIIFARLCGAFRLSNCAVRCDDSQTSIASYNLQNPLKAHWGHEKTDKKSDDCAR